MRRPWVVAVLVVSCGGSSGQSSAAGDAAADSLVDVGDGFVSSDVVVQDANADVADAGGEPPVECGLPQPNGTCAPFCQALQGRRFDSANQCLEDATFVVCVEGCPSPSTPWGPADGMQRAPDGTCYEVLAPCVPGDWSPGDAACLVAVGAPACSTVMDQVLACSSMSPSIVPAPDGGPSCRFDPQGFAFQYVMITSANGLQTALVEFGSATECGQQSGYYLEQGLIVFCPSSCAEIASGEIQQVELARCSSGP